MIEISDEDLPSQNSEDPNSANNAIFDSKNFSSQETKDHQKVMVREKLKAESIQDFFRHGRHF
jgi:hypothetical protein